MTNIAAFIKYMPFFLGIAFLAIPSFFYWIYPGRSNRANKKEAISK
jgi:hypothetical protein